MSQNKNITFFLGSGASRFSCPILSEQGEKMLMMARHYFNDNQEIFLSIDYPLVNENYRFIWDIGYFGTKAIEYGTIDTYAYKLHLERSVDELQRLKLAINNFFTIWFLIEDNDLKTIENSTYKFKKIDHRYMSFMASILDSQNSSYLNLKIKENIRFVSWNYDLQIESAFKAFLRDTVSWVELSKYLRFRIDENSKSPLDICHLNGYHGYYQENSKIQSVLDKIESNKTNSIIASISELYKEQRGQIIDTVDYINYAWETNEKSEKAKKEAKSIFYKTDILIIIGYSFPSFNKDIDRLLFQELKGRKTKIYYQDPNPNALFISQLINPQECEIIYESKNLENFILPF